MAQVSPHLLRHYGLRPTGLAGIYRIRKSITDPATGREHQIVRSTHTPDPARAIEIARAIIDPFLASRGHLRPGATIPIAAGPSPYDRLCALYLSTARCAPATRRKNLACLQKLLAEATTGRTPTLEEIDGRLARQWLLARRTAAERTHLPADQSACEAAKRGANALYRQARSVFSRRQIATYADHGMAPPPSLRDFAEQPLLDAAPPPPCESLTIAQRALLLEALAEARTSDPATYAATLLMFLGGLRNSEAMAATWPMLEETATGDYLLHLYARGAYKPKASSRTITLSNGLIEKLRAIRTTRGEDDPLIPAAHKTARHHACYRGVGALLRRCGIETVKGKLAYRLRAHAITQILLHHGMEAAQQFAGHTSATTTAIYKGSAIPYRPLSL